MFLFRFHYAGDAPEQKKERRREDARVLRRLSKTAPIRPSGCMHSLPGTAGGPVGSATPPWAAPSSPSASPPPRRCCSRPSSRPSSLSLKNQTPDEINLLLQLGRSLCRFIDVLDDRRSCFIASRYCRYPLSIFHSDFFSDLFTLLLWKSVGLEAVFSRGLLGK
jgi:hypothetical protein